MTSISDTSKASVVPAVVLAIVKSKLIVSPASPVVGVATLLIVSVGSITVTLAAEIAGSAPLAQVSTAELFSSVPAWLPAASNTAARYTIVIVSTWASLVLLLVIVPGLKVIGRPPAPIVTLAGVVPTPIGVLMLRPAEDVTLVMSTN